jgi:phosphohistidine swiveling domain-containing protein
MQAAATTTLSAAVTDALIALEAATDPRRCGHKAAALAQMIRLGFDVPDGFVIPVGATASPLAITAALGRLGEGAVAVRSSGVAEDLPDASFAGHYTTVLNVRGTEAVLAAAAACVASARSTGMAVLVQKMVDADAAGVAFSANPLTGDRAEVRISATRGLGDRLVGGAVDGDEWSVRAGRAELFARPSANDPAITVETAQRIAGLARKVETARGAPQDIEWALEGDRLVLLQARPITALPVAPVIETPKGNWLKDVAHFPDVVTPYGASTNLRDDGSFGRAMVEEWGLLPDGFVARAIGHEFYVHVDPDDGGAKPPPWWVLGLVARILPSLRRKLSRARRAVESGLLQSLPAQWTSELKPAMLRQIEAFVATDLTKLDDAALCAHLEQLRQFSGEAMSLHFRLFVPHLVGLHGFARVCKELLDLEVPQTFRFLQGLSLASSAPTRDLAAIAAFARERPAARALIAARGDDVLERLAKADPAVGARLAEYLATWGVRTCGGDAGTPNLDERPKLVADMLADLMERDLAASLLLERERAVAQARATLTDPEARRRFDQALAYAELVYPLREDNVLLTDQLPTGLLRRVGLELGRRLAQRGLLARAHDAAMLTGEELQEALLARAGEGSDGSDLKSTVLRRKAELAWVRANPGPAMYGPPPGPTPDLRGLPEPARRINEALLWGFEQELVPSATAAGDALVGIAASPGVYRGRVRVVRSVEQLSQLRSGEVLVCPTTSPAWMMVFQRAGALVTDAGSTLSHAAIIAREHALPAVVAVSNATSALKDGEEVIVNGNLGTVSRVPAAV